MKNTQKKVFSAIATAALLANSVGAVFAETTSLVITGNGADSHNTTGVAVQNTTSVVQDNYANISNNVNASSSTGSNSANKNTNGEVSISTGDASTGVAVSNSANSNVANIEGCCAVDASVEISGNGADSRNEAGLSLGTSTEVFQTNVAHIDNDIDADSDTGNNEADKNTGGNVEVTTGNADTTVLVDNVANSNLARVGGGNGEGGSVSLRIMGNGADSKNEIGLALERSLSLLQDNYANIENDVDADANTGENEASKSTGGDVMVDTGDASVGVGVDNMANFNVADLDCGCLLDIEAKVAGNGFGSENEIAAKLVDDKLAFQTNVYSCDEGGLFEYAKFGGHKDQGCNNVDAEAETGDNAVAKSTGEADGDPSVTTGNADTLVDLSTTANSNVLTEGGESEWPEFDFDFDFGSNWALLWGWFHGMSM